MRIEPIRPRRRWRVLADADVERLEAAVVEVLGEVGVRFPLQRALDVLERGGCGVDRASQVARLPEQIVRAALQAAPEAPLLAARDPVLRPRPRRPRLLPEQRRLRRAGHRSRERAPAGEHQG